MIKLMNNLASKIKMKIVLMSLSFFVLIFTQCVFPQGKTFKIKFDNTKEVSGKKFAIKDINPSLPSNWDEYNFVIIEFKITTPQRFQLGLVTEYGYNELRVMSYVANGWNKLAIPLKFFRQLPDPNIDLAATYNQPRYTGWINLIGTRSPLHCVDSIGIRMRAPIGNPEIEIRSISLSMKDPGDEYLGTVPAVDEFGQWNLGDFEGKIYSMEQLYKEWEMEDDQKFSKEKFNYSRYGGYKLKKVAATGFFRTEKIDGRWWFVDPDGYLFLSLGADCVAPGGGGYAKDVNKRRNMYKELPPEKFSSYWSKNEDVFFNDRQITDYDFGEWNLYRRHGDDYKEKSSQMIINRMNKWGINTLGNWSSSEIISMNEKAFMLTMKINVMESNLMGLADVYVPDFRNRLDESIKNSVSIYKNNPWLIGYFIGNEPAWLGQEDRLCEIIIKGNNRPIKIELEKFLDGKDTPEKRKEFIFETFRIFLSATNEIQKKYDPNHLNLGIRFGSINNVDNQLLKICNESFDVLSFNCYDLYPQKEMLDRAMEITDLPMIIGEYHFGTVDRGMAQSLWQVDTQKERGIAYRFYTEQGFSHPGLIGVAYFQWCDQDLTGRRNDGENYNCGLIDVTDRPYKYMIEAIIETAKHLYEVHAGIREPYNQQPLRARGHEEIPDLWDK